MSAVYDGKYGGAGMQICEERMKVSSITGLQSTKSDTSKAEVVDSTCGLGPIFSEYCGGQTYWAGFFQMLHFSHSSCLLGVQAKLICFLSIADRLDQTASEQEKTYIQQECRIETYETTDVLSIVSSKDDQFSKITSSWKENDHVEVVTIFNAAINIDESLDFRDKGSPKRGCNDSEDSSGERKFQHKYEIETSIILEDLQEKKETVQIAELFHRILKQQQYAHYQSIQVI